MIFERMDCDVAGAIRQLSRSLEHRRLVLYQIVKGIVLLHSGLIVHRDLKPNNVLLNLETCRVRICDFGLARSIEPETENSEPGVLNADSLTDYVATRWYRSPELILSSSQYGGGVDIWAIGCIAAEMILGSPLFIGDSTIGQLAKVGEVTGIPPYEEMRYIKSATAKGLIDQLGPEGWKKRKDLKNILAAGTPDELDLVTQCLQFDPSKRPSAEALLTHSFFASIRNPDSEHRCLRPVHIPLDDNVRLSAAEYKRHILAIEAGRVREIPLIRPVQTPETCTTDVPMVEEEMKADVVRPATEQEPSAGERDDPVELEVSEIGFLADDGKEAMDDETIYAAAAATIANNPPPPQAVEESIWDSSPSGQRRFSTSSSTKPQLKTPSTACKTPARSRKPPVPVFSRPAGSFPRKPSASTKKFSPYLVPQSNMSRLNLLARKESNQFRRKTSKTPDEPLVRQLPRVKSRIWTSGNPFAAPAVLIREVARTGFCREPSRPALVRQPTRTGLGGREPSRPVLRAPLPQTRELSRPVVHSRATSKSLVREPSRPALVRQPTRAALAREASRPMLARKDTRPVLACQPTRRAPFLVSTKRSGSGVPVDRRDLLSRAPVSVPQQKGVFSLGRSESRAVRRPVVPHLPFHLLLQSGERILF